MKIAACTILVLAILAEPLTGQSPAHNTARDTDSFCKVERDRIHISISAGVMEKLLIYKEEPVFPDVPMRVRATGTVVVSFVLSKNGDVECPMVISGPQMLRNVAIDAVRKYKYKPYLLNGDPVAIETTVSVVFDLD
jgi:TonB family protein